MNSLFTRLFLEALNGKADMNKDGLISLAEVDAYVSGQLAHVDQNPYSTLLRPRNVPTALPLAKLATSAPVAAPQLVGTNWSGKENLGSYGKLTLKFLANGKAVMIDSQSTVEGTWTQTGKQVTIVLPNVARDQGTISGTTPVSLAWRRGLRCAGKRRGNSRNRDRRFDGAPYRSWRPTDKRSVPVALDC
jgi:hypothetical protein